MSAHQKQREIWRGLWTGASARGRGYSQFTMTWQGGSYRKKPWPRSTCPASGSHWPNPARSQRSRKPTDVKNWASFLARSRLKDGEWDRRANVPQPWKIVFIFMWKSTRIYMFQETLSMWYITSKLKDTVSEQWRGVSFLQDRFKGPAVWPDE